MLYKLNITDYGIVEGSLGTSPYTFEEYNQAKNNKIGFQNAMDYAYENNYSGILFPKGTYSLCYFSSPSDNVYTKANLFPKSNQIIDMNGAKFEVIYDSVNRSPFDTTTNPIYALDGSVFRVHKCHNVVIKNGEIKGDIYNRTFSDAAEKSMEQTYGVFSGVNCYNVLYENLNVHGFMGDSFTFSTRSFDGSKLITPAPLDAVPGYVNSSGGIDMVAGCYTSPLIPINLTMLAELTPFALKTIQIQTSGGYTRVPNFKNKTIEIAFYNSSNVFISKRYTKYLHKIVMPSNATAVKLIFTEETAGLTSLPNQGYTIMEQASHKATVLNCKIHDNHRGGISNPCDDIIIDGCEIWHNGMDSSIGVPLFPDNTRYAINFEDTYANSAVIRNCNIYSGYNCMLMGVGTFLIENNTISNFSLAAVVYYEIEKGIVINNSFYNCPALTRFDSVLKREIIFKGNLVETMWQAFSYTNEHTDKVEIIDNTIVCHWLGVMGSKLNFNSNNVKIIDKVGDALQYPITGFVNEFKNNYYEAITKLQPQIFGALDYSGTTFKGVNINSPLPTGGNEINYIGVTFIDCLMKRNTTYPNTAKLTFNFENCKIINSQIYIATEFMPLNTLLKDVIIVFKNCEIKIGLLTFIPTEDTDSFATSARKYSYIFHDSTINYLNDVTKPYVTKAPWDGSNMYSREFTFIDTKVVNNTNFKNTITVGGIK